MTKGTSKTVHFVFKNPTPGTARYQEVNEQGEPINASTGAVIGSLYVRKDALGGEIPQKLRVEIIAE